MGQLISDANGVDQVTIQNWQNAFELVIATNRSARFAFPQADHLFLVQLTPELDGQDRLHAIIGDAVDLNNPLECQHELEELQIQLDAVIRAFPDLFFWLAPDGTIVRCHAGRETIYPLHQLLNQPVYNVLPPEVATPYRQSVERTFARAACPPLEFKLSKPTTGVRWLEARFVRLNDVRVLVVVRDITDRKTVEIQLHEAVAKLKAALEQVNMLQGLVSICANCKKICDTDGKWTDIESYLTRHNLTQFSHCFCPECGPKLYGELWR